MDDVHKIIKALASFVEVSSSRFDDGLRSATKYYLTKVVLVAF